MDKIQAHTNRIINDCIKLNKNIYNIDVFITDVSQQLYLIKKISDSKY